MSLRNFLLSKIFQQLTEQKVKSYENMALLFLEYVWILRLIFNKNKVDFSIM